MAITEDVDIVLGRASRWVDEGKGVAIATVVSTWGSSPRPVGSQLAVEENGAFVGSVSGGCVEAAVVREALDVIKDGKTRMLEYPLADQVNSP